MMRCKSRDRHHMGSSGSALGSPPRNRSRNRRVETAPTVKTVEIEVPHVTAGVDQEVDKSNQLASWFILPLVGAWWLLEFTDSRVIWGYIAMLAQTLMHTSLGPEDNDVIECAVVMLRRWTWRFLVRDSRKAWCTCSADTVCGGTPERNALERNALAWARQQCTATLSSYATVAIEASSATSAASGAAADTSSSTTATLTRDAAADVYDNKVSNCLDVVGAVAREEGNAWPRPTVVPFDTRAWLTTCADDKSRERLLGVVHCALRPLGSELLQDDEKCESHSSGSGDDLVLLTPIEVQGHVGSVVWRDARQQLLAAEPLVREGCLSPEALLAMGRSLLSVAALLLPIDIDTALAALRTLVRLCSGQPTALLTGLRGDALPVLLWLADATCATGAPRLRMQRGWENAGELVIELLKALVAPPREVYCQRGEVSGGAASDCYRVSGVVVVALLRAHPRSTASILLVQILERTLIEDRRRCDDDVGPPLNSKLRSRIAKRLERLSAEVSPAGELDSARSIEAVLRMLAE